MKQTHVIEIGNLTRELPLREVAPGVRVALFDMLGDWELVEEAGWALASRVPAEAEVLIMPDGKATALLHALGCETGLPTVVARKEKKPYFAEPVLEVTYKSITTAKPQTLFLPADKIEMLRNKRVVMVDDVVSSGGSREAIKELVAKAGGELIGTLAVLTEGIERDDVISLGHLPIFKS
jgi:adenine phosphoribosyltransferase